MKNNEQALKENILWLMQNGHMDVAKSCLSDAEGALAAADWLTLLGEWQIRQELHQQARETIALGLAKAPCRQELLEMSLFLATEVERDENESQRAGTLLSMLTGVSIPCDRVPQRALKQTRILHGTMEIANQMHTLSEALNHNGFVSRAVNYYQSYLQYNGDVTIDFSSCRTPEEAALKMKMFAADSLVNYDIFHFHFGTSLTQDHSDLPLLKSLGKKAVMNYWGSDVRRLSIAQKYNPYAVVKNPDEMMIVKSIEKVAAYISTCVVADQELYLYVKDFFPNVYFLPQSMDLSHYSPRPVQRNPKPLFVHAPTNRDVKGTEYILAAIDTLKQEYDFDFQLIQGVSHEQAKSAYQQADLIIDQILLGSYGVLAIESMAMGKPLVCWISEYMRDQYPDDLPVIIANPDTITDVLRHVLCNMDMLPDLGKKGRIYVEKNHDANLVADKLISIYKKL